MSEQRRQFDDYLKPTPFIDSDHPEVVAFAHQSVASTDSDIDKAITLHDRVRDGFRYDPYTIDLTVEGMRASSVLQNGFGFCISKATLLAATARVHGIPSRLGFGDVVNHLASERLKREMQTDLFVFHGYADLYLDGRWVKATPAFNASLCERFNVEPMAFDGRSDSLFQQSDRDGNRYMEYVHDRGRYADVPLDEIASVWSEHYPPEILSSSAGAALEGEADEFLEAESRA